MARVPHRRLADRLNPDGAADTLGENSTGRTWEPERSVKIFPKGTPGDLARADRRKRSTTELSWWDSPQIKRFAYRSWRWEPALLPWEGV